MNTDLQEEKFPKHGKTGIVKILYKELGKEPPPLKGAKVLQATNVIASYKESIYKKYINNKSTLNIIE